MARFNTQKVTNATTNLAGGKAYKHSNKMELVQAVLTTFFENKFYENGSDRLARIQLLIQSVNDPHFVAKLAVIARQEFNMRSVNHVLLAELSKIDSQYIREATIASVVRPDDILEIIAYLNGKLSKQLQRGLRRSLFKFTPYQLAKYKNTNKKVKLVDAFNLLHPNPKFATSEQSEAWSQLMKGELKNIDTWESDIHSIPRLIKERKLGYMALLRNLNNIIKYEWDVIDEVCEYLTNEQAVINSRQLPARFWTAYNNVQGNIKLTDAIVKAMEISLNNVPSFDGKTLVAIDCSGSMKGNPIEIASLFGASLAKANQADVILYDTSVKELKYSSLSTIIDIASKIQTEATGGGTNTALVFAYAEAKYDRIIILSDNESWRTPAQMAYAHYTPKTTPIYCIDIEGYGTTDITGKNTFHLAGWSDALFEFMRLFEQGDTIIDYINNYTYEAIDSINRPDDTEQVEE